MEMIIHSIYGEQGLHEYGARKFILDPNFMGMMMSSTTFESLKPGARSGQSESVSAAGMAAYLVSGHIDLLG